MAFAFEERDGYKLVIVRRVWNKKRNGWVYPKNGRFLRFWVKVK